MRSAETLDRAQTILRRAAAAVPTTQRLLIAAALREVFSSIPILVGGAAEAYWMSEEYRPTDVDICPRPGTDDEDVLQLLGFSRDGRHWVRDDLLYGIEFPGTGDDIRRTVDVSLDDATAVVISLDDLYLDRLRQSTMTETTHHQHFKDAVAILLAQWEAIDWGYVIARIEEIATGEPVVGRAMRGMHPQAVAAARNLLVEIEVRRLRAQLDPPVEEAVTDGPT